MARIRLESVKKYYGSVKAVDDVSMDIEDNEFVVFLGPSGCGKTTTLRCIAGLERVNSGAIYFDDTRVDRLEPADRNIAMVFQFYALYPHLNVQKNIMFPLKAEKMPAGEIRKKVSWVAGLLKIDDILSRKISELPDGDKQKVALARAIVRNPEVLLLDEPLSALDEKFREQMRIEFLRIQKALNVTTVYVTHDQREAMTLADRIVVMKDGKLIEEGAPETLYEEPKNLFTGYFIGSPGMNFIRCMRKNGAVATEGDNTITFSPAISSKLDSVKEDSFIFGIRPEYLFFRKGKPSGGNVCPVKIVNVERLHDIDFGNFYIGKHLYKCIVEGGTGEGTEGFVTFTDEKARLYSAHTNEII
jgi:multiple sugar transport system ATP-binding protein